MFDTTLTTSILHKPAGNQSAAETKVGGDHGSERHAVGGGRAAGADAEPHKESAPPPLEVIGGYPVHPLASGFPLIVGKQFDDLVEAAARAGRLYPVETHEGLLIDGRNRLRVQEELHRRGIVIEVPVVEWEPTGDETVEEHIWSVNANRRHQTADQLAANAIAFLPFLRRRCQERQAATRFGQREAAAQSSSPPGALAAAERTSREKDAVSTVGQFAAMCNIGIHKARQAVALAEGVEAGKISSVEIIAVATGEKRLRDVVPSKRSAGSGKANLKDSVRPEAELLFDVEVVEVDEPAVTEEEVHRRWERFKQPFAVTGHRKLRRLLIKKLREEQQEFDQ
jgi:hypothetical protein